MTIFLARHGESTSNAGAATETPGEAPLTPRGRQQAADLGRQFERLDAVITSTYARAKETGDVITDMAHLADVPLYEWENIQEWNLLEPSKYGGTTHAERESAVGHVIQLWDPKYKDGPGAESFYELLDRARSFRTRIADIPGNETVVVISHGWFIKALLWWFTLEPILHAKLSNTQIMQSFWSFARSFEIGNCQHFRLT